VWNAVRQLRRGADPATRVDVRPVRRHVHELLAAGLTRRDIARAAQIAPSTLTRIAEPSTRRVSRIVARSVLAVQP
jgi:hypothetical protein